MLESTKIMKRVRTRIAPSPTGEDLHIGNAYTALINYIFAQKNKGKFIVRIEDTDRMRLVPGSEKKILTSLKWLGLNPDESPEIGGPYKPYRQSERLPIYQKYAKEAVEKRKAYYCFCSPQRLEDMRKDQQKKGLPPIYDGLCKKLTEAEINGKLSANEKYVIRLNVPDEGITKFTDIIRGEISFENKLIDDQVILKSDGYPTYHLGVVVDDHLMEISHVIRGEEWISSAPKHIIIYNAFGWELPQFAHLPLLRNPDKSKLSKRKNPVWVSWYREEGILPEALLNYLALMGWSMPDGKEIFTLDEMVRQFKLEEVQTSAPVFDIKKLEWLNGEYIRMSQKEKLKIQILEFYKNANLPEAIVEKTIPLIQERIKKLSDYLSLCEFFFKKPEKYESQLNGKNEILLNIINSLKKVHIWQKENISTEMQKLAAKYNMKLGDFFMILRIAITGKKITPPITDSMEILGKDETLLRLHKATKES